MRMRRATRGRPGHGPALQTRNFRSNFSFLDLFSRIVESRIGLHKMKMAASKRKAQEEEKKEKCNAGRRVWRLLNISEFGA